MSNGEIMWQASDSSLPKELHAVGNVGFLLLLDRPAFGPHVGDVVPGEEAVERLRSGTVECELRPPELGHRLCVENDKSGVIDVRFAPVNYARKHKASRGHHSSVDSWAPTKLRTQVRIPRTPSTLITLYCQILFIICHVVRLGRK